MDTDALIDCVARRLEGEPGVRALCLSGSHGAGLADAYSDLDFLAILSDPHMSAARGDAFSDLWRAALEPAGGIVLWRVRSGPTILINAITTGWLRIDVLATTADPLHTRRGLKVLFDRDGIAADLPETPEPGIDRDRLAWQIEEFIRILGLLPVAMGRAEYLNAVTGVFHLRNLLIDLMIAETGAPHRGGALHLNRLITDDQKALLTALPAPVPTRESAIATHLAYAGAYLPLARPLADRLGIDWPEPFERATWSHLERELAIDRPS
ncbi:hypothetical protein [Microbaculum marinum]|uniref:Polymerase nucleotidyl transferase domain-containing protein n=1 Tax=Microbaculum marinum TaxID=1764581 RepID=A0AAW9RSV0_9HYPH